MPLSAFVSFLVAVSKLYIHNHSIKDCKYIVKPKSFWPSEVWQSWAPSASLSLPNYLLGVVYCNLLGTNCFQIDYMYMYRLTEIEFI